MPASTPSASPRRPTVASLPWRLRTRPSTRRGGPSRSRCVPRPSPTLSFSTPPPPPPPPQETPLLDQEIRLRSQRDALEAKEAKLRGDHKNFCDATRAADEIVSPVHQVEEASRAHYTLAHAAALNQQAAATAAAGVAVSAEAQAAAAAQAQAAATQAYAAHHAAGAANAQAAYAQQQQQQQVAAVAQQHQAVAQQAAVQQQAAAATATATAAATANAAAAAAAAAQQPFAQQAYPAYSTVTPRQDANAGYLSARYDLFFCLPFVLCTPPHTRAHTRTATPPRRCPRPPLP